MENALLCTLPVAEKASLDAYPRGFGIFLLILITVYGMCKYTEYLLSIMCIDGTGRLRKAGLILSGKHEIPDTCTIRCTCMIEGEDSFPAKKIQAI